MAIVGHIDPQNVVSYVVDRWDDLKTSRSEKERVWAESVDCYLSRFSPAMVDWLKKNQKSARYIGLPWDAVETVYSQVMAQMFPGDQWLKMRPSEPGDFQYDDKAAEAVKRLLLQQHRQSDFYDTFGNTVVKQALILGSAPFTHAWDIEWTVDYPQYSRAMTGWMAENERAWQEFMVQAQQFQMQMKALVAQGVDPSTLPQQMPFSPPPPPVPEDKIAYQGPVLDGEDLFNFVIDPFPNRKLTAFRCKRTFKTLAYLRRFAIPDEMGYAPYQNLDDISEIDMFSSKSATDSQIASRAAAFGLGVPKKNRGIELLEAQGDMEIPIDGGGNIQLFINYIATVANGKTLIRFEPGYLWINQPATQLATICRPPGEVYGIGILEPNRGTNEIIQARSNQLVDGVAAAINPEYKCVDDGIIDLNATSAPGKRHLVGKLDNLEPIQKNLSGIHAAMQDYAMLKGEYQQGTRSINPSVPMYQRSATEISQNAGVIGATLGQIVNDLEKTGLARAIRHQVCLDAMYINQSVMAYTVQNGVDAWLPVSPYDIRRGWIEEICGSKAVAERTQKIQDLMFFMQMTGGNPVYAPFMRHLYLLKKMYGEMGFMDGNEAFVDEKVGTDLLIEMMLNGTLMGMGAKSNGAPNVGGKPSGGADQSGSEDAGQGPAGPMDPGSVSGPWVSDDPNLPGDGSFGALQKLRA